MKVATKQVKRVDKPIKPKKEKLSAQEIQAQFQVQKDFYEAMFNLNLYNKFDKTYDLHIKNVTIYGYFVHLYIASGLSFNMLAEKTKVLEDNLQCMWIMKQEKFRKYAEVQIVLRPVDKDKDYENPNLKPWEMYLGLSFSNKLLKVNANDKCMFLISGATGAGKTRFIYLVLLSWILGCSPDEVWLYIADIAKNEYINYEHVKHVKYYASELDELVDMMKKIDTEFNRRKKLIGKLRASGKGTNIEDYNKVNKNNKLAYCYILIDEFSVIVADKTDNKSEKEQKEYVLDMIKKLEKTGRSFGIFCIIATQKTTRDEIPSIIKNMSAVRISLRANDAISSEVIMGDNSAMGLPDRVAVYSTNGGSIKDYLYTPKIETDTMCKLLEPHMKGSNQQLQVVNGENKKNMVRGRVTNIPKALEYIKGSNNDNVIDLFKQSNDDGYNII